MNKYKLKFRSKPCITTGLQKSISVKNKFLTDFIKKKDLLKKQNFNCNTKPQKPIVNPFEKKVKKIIIRNVLSQIGIMPKSSGKVLNPS